MEIVQPDSNEQRYKILKPEEYNMNLALKGKTIAWQIDEIIFPYFTLKIEAEFLFVWSQKFQ